MNGISLFICVGCANNFLKNFNLPFVFSCGSQDARNRELFVLVYVGSMMTSCASPLDSFCSSFHMFAITAKL